MNSLQTHFKEPYNPIHDQARNIMLYNQMKSAIRYGELLNNPYVLQWCSIHGKVPFKDLLQESAVISKKRVTFEDQVEPVAKRVKSAIESQNLHKRKK